MVSASVREMYLSGLYILYGLPYSIVGCFAYVNAVAERG